MKYQLSRHIEVQIDPQDSEKILLSSLRHGSRMLADDKIWTVLQQYQQPSDLGDTKLEARARQARLIEPLELQDWPPGLRESFDEVSRKVLKYRKVEAKPDLLERLEQLAQTCTPLAPRKPLEYFIWHDPALVFNVMLEHFRVYLESEFGADQTMDVDPDFLKMSLGRPPRQESLEQQVVTLETAWRRAQRIVAKQSPSDRILIIGDDDLVSLALSRFNTETIDVLELDSQLVRLLKRRGGERLRVFRRDLSDGLPEDFVGQYDVVVSDPMYSKDGMAMFLECCASALKPEARSRLYLTTYPPLLEDSDDFFAGLESKGLAIHETLENFSRYPFPNDMRAGGLEGLKALGYHPKLCQVLLQVPYLYAHQFECGLSQIS